MQRLHELLASGRYPNCRQVATEFEVSSKTISRDLEFMRDQLKLPVEYHQKLRGYFYTRAVECPIALSIPIWESDDAHNLLSRGQAGLRQTRGCLTQAVSARIWFDSQVASEVAVLYPDDSRSVEHHADGSIVLAIKDGPLEGLDRWILSWGARARVVEPLWLRDRVMKIARDLVEMYR
jgi:predicted DNA-binding transcriptional regulator YafY